MRKANLIQTAIWDEPAFHALNSDAKLVYLLLLTQAKVTAVGSLDIAPKRWADATGLTPARLTKALTELEQDEFIWTDPAKEELIIRSWVKHNVLGSPKMMQASVTHFTVLSSLKLQYRLQVAYPSLFGTPSDALHDTLSDTLYRKSDAVAGVEVHGAEVQVVSSSSESEQAREQVWDAYAAHHPAARLTTERKRLIDNRLHDGYTADQLVAAIEGNHRDAYCNGDNASGRQYHAFDLILRNADKIEQYGNVPANGNHPTSAAGRTLELARKAAQEGH
jgi:hypothetical protein